MKKIIIIGAGGHAAEVRDYIRFFNISAPEKILVEGFIDDDKNIYEHYKYDEPYLGEISNHEVRIDVNYVMGIANLKYRRPLIEKFLEKGATFQTIIHPTALISPSAKIGNGVLISHNSSVGPMVKIGNFNILNSRCTIGHDTILGDFNFISPQVALSGHTTIGNENMFGVNSATIPGVVIGNNNQIGAGSIITKNIENYSVVVGVPGKMIKNLEPSSQK